MKLVDVANKIKVRRASWPEGDYVQIIGNTYTYFDHSSYKSISNFIMKPEDILATDWQVKEK